ncbi:LCP family protein [Cohnella caldifontis]|uniref:LCP family protein n=1 Tax=Cohnella caldifontis TaxID=3027471 RepID=UPI0023EAECA4|nr:LCP family protein [Cohnella sp. YIM B05605]
MKTMQALGNISDPAPSSASEPVGSVLTPSAVPVPSPVVQPTNPAERPLGMLILGLDNRKQTGSMNTDVMMAAVLEPDGKTVTVVSIPRDSDLNVPGFAKQKANSFYARYYTEAVKEFGWKSDEARRYASNKMESLLSDFFGIPFTYTAVLDFQGFIDVVDELGGISVYVDQDMRWWDTADGTDIDLKKGQQVLDGEDALGFVRYRHSKNGETRESSDFERNDRQDRVLRALIDKLKSFQSLTKLGGLLDAVGDNVRTDIPQDVLTDLIKHYFGVDRDHVRFIALTGEWISPVVVLDSAKLEEARTALREAMQTESDREEGLMLQHEPAGPLPSDGSERS